MGYHARLSPSGASRWSVCTASPSEEAGKPNESNEASRWGTANHLLSSTCLERGDDPAMWADWQVIFWHHPESESEGESLIAPDDQPDPALEIAHVVPVDDEQIECASSYVNFVRELRHSLDAEMHVEQAVPIDHITGESEATGTSDVVLVPRQGDTLTICDLKGGMYRVDAYKPVMRLNDELVLEEKIEINKQLAMYASGALRKFDQHNRFKHVRLIIVQPRLSHISEITVTVAELGEIVRDLREKAKQIEINPVYAPGFETCHYCKGKLTCGPFQREVVETVFTDQSMTKLNDIKPYDLETLYQKVDMIDLFTSTIRAEMWRRLVNFEPMTKYKLVAGRMGNRYFDDPKRVEEIVTRDFGVPKKLTHVEKMIGPASFEKLSKKSRGKPPVLNEVQWAILKAHIKQDEGKPVVVPIEDHRPALTSGEEAFGEVADPASAVSERSHDPLNLGPV